MSNLPPEPVRDLARAAANQILSAVLHASPISRAIVEQIKGRDVVVSISIVPLPSVSRSPLTGCEQAVLAVVRRANRRVTTPEIFNALSMSGIHFGDSTVKLSLARLVHRGHLDSSKKCPRGYLLISSPVTADSF